MKRNYGKDLDKKLTKLEALKEKHRKIDLHKAEIIAATLLILILGITFYKPSLTGFVPANVERHPLDIKISESQVYNLISNESLPLVSFGISGNITGKGAVYVYLDNAEGVSKLVYTNVRKPRDPSGFLRITGLTTVSVEQGPRIDQYFPLAPDEEAVYGTFINECVETCALPLEGFDKTAYKLTFLVEPGAVLYISEIIYLVGE